MHWKREGRKDWCKTDERREENGLVKNKGRKRREIK